VAAGGDVAATDPDADPFTDTWDVNGDGVDEIVTGDGPGAGPR
jgi:hypothetical protein